MELTCRRAEFSREYPNCAYHRVTTNSLFQNWMMWREEFFEIKEMSVGLEGDVYDEDDEEEENPWKIEEQIRDEGEFSEKQNRDDFELLRKEEEETMREKVKKAAEKREILRPFPSFTGVTAASHAVTVKNPTLFEQFLFKVTWGREAEDAEES